MWVAVIAGLAAGFMFAAGSVLQQGAAREAPLETSLSWRLLVDLAHRPKWVLGIAGDAASFGLQALALAYGPLALVQPIIVTGILFSIPMAVRVRGMRLHAREWLATVAVAGGLATFLVAASPTEGVPEATLGKWVLILVAVGGVMVLGVLVGQSARGPLRASSYAVAAGAAFGLLAALTKASTHLLSQGATVFFSSWQPYALAVVAVLGAIVQQSAFQAGPLPASVPVMDAMEPTVAVLIGVFAFAEHLATDAGSLALEALGIVLLLAGIVTLDRSPVVLELQRAGDEEQAAAARSSTPPTGLCPDGTA